ncbi:MAG TPA: MarR family transcriptional regulator [Geminicoccaceae bacterium]|nr:MarR family transcriptional regulator [Geminicoccus sp.]HMU51580.1 MarR family transcriptional regulator [Geminicoccaceae bacterium]
MRDADLDRGLDLLLAVEREMAGRTAAALERHGLTAVDFRSLYLIGRRPGVTLAELARQTGISKQALSRQLQRLIDGGGLVREAVPGDRRKQRLRLTDTAAASVEEVVALQRRMLRAAFKRAGAEAVEGFGRVLAALADETGRRQPQRDAA